MKNGFTLIELVVSIAIFSVIGLGTILLVSNLFTNSNQQSGLLADTGQARKLSFQMMNELRNSTTGANGAYALDTAGDQQLTFYSNSDSDAALERIRYYVSNGKLYKGVTEPTGNSYNLANEVSTVVQNNLANGATPIFYYYDGSYNGTTNNFLTQPVNTTAVKLIKLNLQVYNKAGVKKTNFYTITGSATIRNVKTNL